MSGTYPKDDSTGRARGLPGAGVLAYLTGDQLHPMMIDDEGVWADGRRWVEGAVEHTRAAARFARVQPGERVLDIGCGVGGPARTLATEFGTTVYAISNVPHMLETARERTDAALADAVEFELHDCEVPYVRSGFDLAWSMNMIYHVADKPAMLRNAYDALRPGGRLMIEDWMLTPLATEADVMELEYHFESGAYARVDELVRELLAAQFTLTAVEDLGHVGRTHMARHFEPQMNDYFRPQVVAEDEEWGNATVDDFIEAVAATIRMYEARSMTYVRLLATRD
jgi:cyclopropane fatty-acyl-phospholipid synthase-like methyltransferase